MYNTTYPMNTVQEGSDVGRLKAAPPCPPENQAGRGRTRTKEANTGERGRGRTRGMEHVVNVSAHKTITNPVTVLFLCRFNGTSPLR